MSCNCDCLGQTDYDQSLFGCCSDMSSCLCASCFPHCSAGYYVGKSENAGFNFLACICPVFGIYRLRRNNIAHHKNQQSVDGSIIAAVCCSTCALAQDIHELKHQRSMIKAQQRQQNLPPVMVAMPMSPQGSPIIVTQGIPSYPTYSPPHHPHPNPPHMMMQPPPQYQYPNHHQ